MARRFPLSRPRSKARQTVWAGYAQQAFVAVASTAKVIIGSFVPDASTNNMLYPTVVRTRGMLTIRAEDDSADRDIVGAFGLAVVSADAFAIGITAVPGPFSDSGWGGWLVLQPFGLHVAFASAVGVDKIQTDIEVDSKAMRKIAPNNVLVLVAESNTGAYRISSPVRVLLKVA